MDYKKRHEGVPDGWVFFTLDDLGIEDRRKFGSLDIARFANTWLYHHTSLCDGAEREIKTVGVLAHGDCIYHPSFCASDLIPLRLYLAGRIDGIVNRE